MTLGYKFLAYKTQIVPQTEFFKSWSESTSSFCMCVRQAGKKQVWLKKKCEFAHQTFFVAIALIWGKFCWYFSEAKDMRWHAEIKFYNFSCKSWLLSVLKNGNFRKQFWFPQSNFNTQTVTYGGYYFKVYGRYFYRCTASIWALPNYQNGFFCHCIFQEKHHNFVEKNIWLIKLV